MGVWGCLELVHLLGWLMGALGFPGGSVVKNLPADVGDTASISGLGRSLG